MSAASSVDLDMGFEELPDEPHAPRVHQVRDRPDDLCLTRSGFGEPSDEVEKRAPSSFSRAPFALLQGENGCLHAFYTSRFRKVFRLIQPNSPCGPVTLRKTADFVIPPRGGNIPDTLSRR